MSALLSGPSELHANARRIREHAAELRHRSALLTRAAEDARWRSPAATTFRRRVDEVAGRMRRGAGSLDTAADTLDRHARHVAHTLRSLEHAAVGAVRIVVG